MRYSTDLAGMIDGLYCANPASVLKMRWTLLGLYNPRSYCRQFGPIPRTSVGEFPDPRPGPGDALVTIKAAAVNYVDSLVVAGKYQFLPECPFAPGKLPVGEISALGLGVTGLEIGDRVLTFAEQGGYAEKGERRRAAMLRVAAVHELRRCRLDVARLRHVLVCAPRTRASTGRGKCARPREHGRGRAGGNSARQGNGSKVLAGVSKPAKSSHHREAGADEVIDLSTPNLRDELREQVFLRTIGQSADIVLVPIGGDAFEQRCAPRVVIGFASR